MGRCPPAVCTRSILGNSHFPTVTAPAVAPPAGGRTPHTSVAGASLWKFPWQGFGKLSSSPRPSQASHLLTPQREPHRPHQGFSCDQGKYYLALLMFNAPTSPWPPHSRALSLKRRQWEEGSGDEASLLGTWQGCQQMTVSVCVCGLCWTPFAGRSGPYSFVSWHPCLPEYLAPLPHPMPASSLRKLAFKRGSRLNSKEIQLNGGNSGTK